MSSGSDVLAEKRRQALETLDRIRKIQREQYARVPKKVLAARETLVRRYKTMRDQFRKTGEYDPLQCEAKIHRVELTVVIFPLNAFPWKAFGRLPGARLLDPERLWNQTYGFVRRIRCTGGIREIAVEYQRRYPLGRSLPDHNHPPASRRVAIRGSERGPPVLAKFQIRSH